MKRALIITAIAFFLLGIKFGVWIEGKRSLPKSIDIIKNGEVVGAAWTDEQLTKILIAHDGNNPGAYLSFPIYQPIKGSSE